MWRGNDDVVEEKGGVEESCEDDGGRDVVVRVEGGCGCCGDGDGEEAGAVVVADGEREEDQEWECESKGGGEGGWEGG